MKEAFTDEIKIITRDIKATTEKNKAIKTFISSLRVEAEFTHGYYVKDDEYIPHGDDIEAFLNHEIVKPVIRWKDSSQLGYVILPNKYFYRYEAPVPAKDLLDDFWNLEKEAEKLLEGLARA